MKYINNNNCDYKILKNNIVVFYDYLKSLCNNEDFKYCDYLESSSCQDILQYFYSRNLDLLINAPKNFKTIFNKINVVLRKIKKNHSVELSNNSTLIFKSKNERH
jgi:hypothetical protein